MTENTNHYFDGPFRSYRNPNKHFDEGCLEIQALSFNVGSVVGNITDSAGDAVFVTFEADQVPWIGHISVTAAGVEKLTFKRSLIIPPYCDPSDHAMPRLGYRIYTATYNQADKVPVSGTWKDVVITEGSATASQGSWVPVKPGPGVPDCAES